MVPVDEDAPLPALVVMYSIDSLNSVVSIIVVCFHVYSILFTNK